MPNASSSTSSTPTRFHPLPPSRHLISPSPRSLLALPDSSVPDLTAADAGCRSEAFHLPFHNLRPSHIRTMARLLTQLA